MSFESRQKLLFLRPGPLPDRFKRSQKTLLAPFAIVTNFGRLLRCGTSILLFQALYTVLPTFGLFRARLQRWRGTVAAGIMLLNIPQSLERPIVGLQLVDLSFEGYIIRRLVASGSRKSFRQDFVFQHRCLVQRGCVRGIWRNTWLAWTTGKLMVTLGAYRGRLIRRNFQL